MDSGEDDLLLGEGPKLYEEESAVFQDAPLLTYLQQRERGAGPGGEVAARIVRKAKRYV